MNLRKRLTILLGFMCFACFGWADTVYLKDGKLLKGRITSEDDKSILIETDTEWKRISKDSIEMIKKDDLIEQDKPVMNEVTRMGGEQTGANEYQNIVSDHYKKLRNENTIKIMFDLGGIHDSNGTIDMIPYSSSNNTDSSASISGEYAYYPNMNLGVGFGSAIQLARKMTKYEGKFYFIPIYGLMKLRTEPDKHGSYRYVVGQLGYNFFYGDETYKGLNTVLSGGLYYGLGAGIRLYAMQFEALYSVNNGSFKQSFYVYDYYGYRSIDAKGDITYSKLSIALGYHF